MKVTLFRDFAEDKRTSMEVYADNLSHYLTRQSDNTFQIRGFRPKLTTFVRGLPEAGNLRMRFARYFVYPMQAQHEQGELNHILDHGYAHLLRVLDPGTTIITVHDLIPLLAGQGKISGIDSRRRSPLSEYSASFLKKAAHLIAISHNTKNDLVEQCGCDPARITEIYYGVSPEYRPFAQEEQEQCRHALNLPDNATRLVLIIGGPFYKNQETSLKVFERLQARASGNPVMLVRLGRQSGSWDACLRSSPCRDQVIYLEYLTQAEMVFLYNAVDCLLFPSWYEGFGWPPLEAMACGTPVVVSNRASLPEAVGDAGLLCAPDDVDGLARAVTKLLREKDFREQQIQKGYTQIRNFNWQKNARGTVALYRKLEGIIRKNQEDSSGRITT